MADSAVVVTSGTGTNIDTRTEATNGHHRQVVVLGDPATNAGVAPVDATAGLKVDLGTDNDVVVTNAGTFATQATLQAGSAAIGKLAANSGVDIGDVDVTSSALPTGASTSAKQPALGTAGTASTDVITVQGIASMTALKVDNSAVTQPVSGTVTANLSATDNAVLDSIQAGTDKIPALGQALAAGSVPVVMTASQLTTLTPPAAITGFATSAKQDTIIGHVDGVETLLGTIDSKLGGTLTVTGGGGGTEYTEDAAAAANPVGTVLQLIREDARAGGLTTTDGDNVAVRGNNKGEMYVKTTDSDALLTTIDADTSTLAGAVSGTEMQVDVLTMPTTAVTNAGITTIAGAVSGTEMQVDVLTMPTVTVNAHAVTNAGTFATQVDGAALTSLQLADDVVATLGTTTYTEATTKGTTIGAVRRDADTTLVDTTNEIGPLQMDANGRLKVEAFSGETLPVSLTSTTVTGTVAVTQSGTWDEVGINDSGNSITIDNSTLAVVGGGTEATAMRVTLANDSTGLVSVDDNGSSLSVDWNGTQPVTGSGTATGALRVELPTNGTGVIATVGAVTAITNALPAGTNAIGKLAANSGVDIGDVDVTSIAAGTNTIGDVGIKPRTTGGLTTYHLVSAATTNATNIKASAGQVFGWYIYNSNAAARKVVFHNTAGTPTAGASVYFSLMIPPSAGANVFSDIGIPFSTGIAITTVTGLADSDSAAVAANDLIINIFYS